MKNLTLRDLVAEDGKSYYDIVKADDIKGQFPQLNHPRKKIIASVAKLNESPEVSRTLGIFDNGNLVGFVQYFRKKDPSKRDEFEETDDFIMQLDPDYSARIDSKQLAVSPFFVNIAIGEEFRNRGYSKAAMFLLKELLSELQIDEIFMIVEHGNVHSEGLCRSIGAELISDDFYQLFRLNL